MWSQADVLVMTGAYAEYPEFPEVLVAQFEFRCDDQCAGREILESYRIFFNADGEAVYARRTIYGIPQLVPNRHILDLRRREIAEWPEGLRQ